LTEIPVSLLENQMLISGMLFRNFQTISRGCPQIGNSGIFEIFTLLSKRFFEQKLPPEPKWRFLDHFSASSLDLFRRMLKEEI
jgi:hypothetical protein